MTEAVELTAGALAATFVPDVAMVCVSLRHRDRELLDPRRGLDAYRAKGATMGIPLLHPWANRLGGWEYELDGVAVALPREGGLVRGEEHGLPIHGLLPAALPFALLERGEAVVRARLSFAREELLALFPAPHELDYHARLDEAGLHVELTLRPTGEVAVPACLGLHPYLAIRGDRGAARIELPACERLLVDDRLLPTGAHEPLPAGERPLAEEAWDTPLAGLQAGAGFALHADGERTAVRFDHGFPYGQVFAPLAAPVVCFEPMCAPADALRLGNAPRVAPGAEYRAAFSVLVG